MTDQLRAAAQAALEAITEIEGYSRSAVADKIARDAKQVLRVAGRISKEINPPESGPVAWIRSVPPHDISRIRRGGNRWTPLFAHPPRRDWHGLTRAEIADIALDCYAANGAEFDDFALAAAVEAKLKEKNHE